MSRILNVAVAQMGPNNRDEPRSRVVTRTLELFKQARSVGANVAVAAPAGVENDVPLIAGSCIVVPFGEVVAIAQTQDDELVCARCTLDDARFGRKTMFDFAKYRPPDAYRMRVERVGAIEPEP